MNTDQKKAVLSAIHHGQARVDVSLAQLTSIKIGGAASVLVEAHEAIDIANTVLCTREAHIPLYILGGGSNLLFDDNGFDGVVLKLQSAPEKVSRETKQLLITFPAGYPSHLASVKAKEYGCIGFEGMYGLPGTIGGAVNMNSKWPKSNFSTADRLVSVLYLDETGSLKTIMRSELKFSYGYCNVQERKGIIISATFLFEKAEPQEIQKNYDEVMEYRRKTQPTGVHTAGCVFKNISEEEKMKHKLPTTSAGYLLDQCGMKEVHKNALGVSSVHANFFVNKGGATAKDFIFLKEVAQEKVAAHFGIDLREEVVLVQNKM